MFEARQYMNINVTKTIFQYNNGLEYLKYSQLHANNSFQIINSLHMHYSIRETLYEHHVITAHVVSFSLLSFTIHFSL